VREISRFEPFLRGAVVPETIHNEISPCPIQVSNFVQTAALNGQKLRAAILEDVDTRLPVVGRVSMPSADLILFRHYADEALRWAVQSKNEKEIQALVELARAWTQAAANSPPEYRTL
jgi:hypothetical protein